MKKIWKIGVSTTLLFGLAIVAETVSAETTVRYGLWAKPGEAQHDGALKFKEVLEDVSGGEFVVEVYPGNQLGTPREMLAQLALNTTQVMASGDPGIKEIEYLALPFLMSSLDRYEAVMDDPISEPWTTKLIDGRKVRLLGFMPRSPRQFSSNNAINSVADMEGLNIRAPQRDYYVESLDALGAKPTPLPFKEVYSALQTGLVSGQENPIETIYGAKFHEVQSHVAMVGYIHKPAYVMISAAFWDDLTDEQRGWLKEASAAQTALTEELIDQKSDELIALMKEKGVEFTYPDREEFKTALWPVTEKLGKDVWGDDTFAAIVAIGQSN